MSPGAAARLALLAYPPSFRERYGVEMAGLVEDRGGGASVVTDLLVGAARAWARPFLGGDEAERVRLRRQATVSTVWVSWCGVLVVSSAVLRLVEDPPPPGFRPGDGGWLLVHDLVGTALAVGWLLVLLAGVPLGLRALRRGPSVRRAVLPPVAMLAGCVLLFVPLQAYASGHWLGRGVAADVADPPLWWVLLAVFWALALAVTAAWGTVGFAVGLRRAALPATALRLPARTAVLVVLPMAVVVVLVVAVALVGAGPGAAGVGFAPFVWLGLTTLLGCVVAAGVSAGRAVRAGRLTG